MVTNVGFSADHAKKRIEVLLTSGQTVFTTQDLATIWGISDTINLYSTIQYYVRTNRLKRIHKGVYALGSYTTFQVAQKILTPSYLSFYTALAAHGIVFQFYEEIHSMALVSKKIKAGSNVYVYHQLKDSIFFNPQGIEHYQTYLMANPERAIGDSLYLVPGIAFDSLRGINPRSLQRISTLYQNQRLEKEVAQLLEIMKEKNAQ